VHGRSGLRDEVHSNTGEEADHLLPNDLFACVAKSLLGCSESPD
jgi:hypothetical protein